jgi:UDP-N-acetylmuramate dehydrogenase
MNAARGSVAAAVDLAADVLGPLAERDVPIGPLTTYRVGGRAALLVRADDPADLATVGRAVVASGLPVLVVGRGSNLLIADRGFAGLALVLGPWAHEIVVEGTAVTARGAVSLPVLARQTVAAGLTGLEWAVGVPGSVGGGVRMNAGGHGSDIASALVGVRVFDLRTGEDCGVPGHALGLRFRGSDLEDHHVVVSARFELAHGDRDESEATLAEIVRWRREHQPGGQNAGSVFRNPPGDSAGRLIDEAGLKGLRVGRAVVSTKHANFFQAEDGATARDVIDLVAEVQRRVAEATGVELVPELHVVGDDTGSP